MREIRKTVKMRDTAVQRSSGGSQVGRLAMDSKVLTGEKNTPGIRPTAETGASSNYRVSVLTAWSAFALGSGSPSTWIPFHSRLSAVA